MMESLTLHLLPERYAILQLEPGKSFDPPGQGETSLFAILHTPEETTVVCVERVLPESCLWQVEKGWRALKVAGVLAFELVGILASLLAPLAKAKVSVFTLSTYSTDLILVKETHLEVALKVLKEAGHLIER